MGITPIPPLQAVTYAPDPPAATRVSDFTAIYQSQHRYVWESLRRLGVRHADLEDITHEVFVTIYRKLHTYDASRPVRPWIFGIAMRHAADYRKSARVRREELVCEVSDCMIDGAVGGSNLALQRIADHQAYQLLLSALGALDWEQRLVFVMHELDGFSIPEIAEVIEVPINTLYSRLRLARQQFTAVMQRQLGHGFGEGGAR